MTRGRTLNPWTRPEGPPLDTTPFPDPSGGYDWDTMD